MVALDLKDLIRRVKSQADKVHSNFVTDEEITDFLQASFNILYGKIALKNNTYFVEKKLFQVKRKTSYFPYDLYKIKRIDRYYGDNFITLRRRNSDSEMDASNNQYGGYIYNNSENAYEYSFFGDKLRIYPNNDLDLNSNLVFYYIPSPPLLSSGKARLHRGWEQWVVYDAVIKADLKGQKAVNMLQAKANNLLMNILKNADERDYNAPKSITITKDYGLGGLGYLNGGTPFPYRIPSEEDRDNVFDELMIPYFNELDTYDDGFLEFYRAQARYYEFSDGVAYIGFQHKDDQNQWCVCKVENKRITYGIYTQNSSYSTLSDGWDNRSSLTYVRNLVIETQTESGAQTSTTGVAGVPNILFGWSAVNIAQVSNVETASFTRIDSPYSGTINFPATGLSKAYFVIGVSGEGNLNSVNIGGIDQVGAFLELGVANGYRYYITENALLPAAFANSNIGLQVSNQQTQSGGVAVAQGQAPVENVGTLDIKLIWSDGVGTDAVPAMPAVSGGQEMSSSRGSEIYRTDQLPGLPTLSQSFNQGFFARSCYNNNKLYMFYRRSDTNKNVLAIVYPESLGVQPVLIEDFFPDKENLFNDTDVRAAYSVNNNKLYFISVSHTSGTRTLSYKGTNILTNRAYEFDIDEDNASTSLNKILGLAAGNTNGSFSGRYRRINDVRLFSTNDKLFVGFNGEWNYSGDRRFRVGIYDLSRNYSYGTVTTPIGSFNFNFFVKDNTIYAQNITNSGRTFTGQIASIIYYSDTDFAIYENSISFEKSDIASGNNIDVNLGPGQYVNLYDNITGKTLTATGTAIDPSIFAMGDYSFNPYEYRDYDISSRPNESFTLSETITNPILFFPTSTKVWITSYNTSDKTTTFREYNLDGTKTSKANFTVPGIVTCGYVYNDSELFLGYVTDDEGSVESHFTAYNISAVSVSQLFSPVSIDSTDFKGGSQYIQYIVTDGQIIYTANSSDDAKSYDYSTRTSVTLVLPSNSFSRSEPYSTLITIGSANIKIPDEQLFFINNELFLTNVSYLGYLTPGLSVWNKTSEGFTLQKNKSAILHFFVNSNFVGSGNNPLSNHTNFSAQYANQKIYILSTSDGSGGKTVSFRVINFIPETTRAATPEIPATTESAQVASELRQTQARSVTASRDNRLKLLIPVKSELAGSPAAYIDNFLYIAIPGDRELVRVYYDENYSTDHRSDFTEFQTPAESNGNVRVYKSNNQLADSFVGRLISLEVL